MQNLVEKFSENIISIYGIGSFFDRKLPDNWIKNDIDMICICIVKNIEKIPKIQPQLLQCRPISNTDLYW